MTTHSGPPPTKGKPDTTLSLYRLLAPQIRKSVETCRAGPPPAGAEAPGSPRAGPGRPGGEPPAGPGGRGGRGGGGRAHGRRDGTGDRPYPLPAIVTAEMLGVPTSDCE